MENQSSYLTPSSYALEVDNLTLCFDKQKVLDEVSFKLQPGKMVAILGPNGAGKSTLLKSLSGEIGEAKSAINLLGKPLTDYSLENLAQARATLPQFIQLDFPFLVSEIIEMSLLKRLPLAEQTHYIDQALALFDVQHLKGRNYLTLSGGEQQRVQLCRVVAQVVLQAPEQLGKPRYLFLDECVSSLDLAHQHQVFSVLNQLIEKHSLSILVVLHDLNLAAQYADSALLFKQGKLVCQDEVTKVLTQDNIKQVYGFDADIMQHPNGWPMVVPASVQDNI